MLMEVAASVQANKEKEKEMNRKKHGKAAKSPLPLPLAPVLASLSLSPTPLSPPSLSPSSPISPSVLPSVLSPSPTTSQCLPLPSHLHDICLTTENLLSLLPRKSSLEKTQEMYRNLIDRIYTKLSHQPFISSSTGIQCSPSQLVAVHHLTFNPSTYISEEILFACTGKRYINPLELTLDDEMSELLHITPFDSDIVLSCVTGMLGKDGYLSNTALAGILLALDRLSGRYYCDDDDDDYLHVYCHQYYHNKHSDFFCAF